MREVVVFLSIFIFLSISADYIIHIYVCVSYKKILLFVLTYREGSLAVNFLFLGFRMGNLFIAG